MKIGVGDRRRSGWSLSRSAFPEKCGGAFDEKHHSVRSNTILSRNDWRKIRNVQHTSSIWGLARIRVRSRAHTGAMVHV